MSMTIYILTGANILILAISLVMIARILGADYKYRDLDEANEPLVRHGQGDYRKDIRPSDLMPIRFVKPEVEYCSDPNCPTCEGRGTYIDSDGFPDACLRDI